MSNFSENEEDSETLEEEINNLNHEGDDLPVDNVGHTIPRRSSRTPKPENMEDYVSYLVMKAGGNDLQTFEKACTRLNKNLGLTAVQEEYKSLAENKTWILTDLSTGRKALDTKWVFKT